MQATVATAVSAYPSLIPGPFILLLALPAIPLLLFSLGARPPDTSSLPFSTDDLWQTTAFITLAGGVVLAVGLYPGLLGDVGQWVAEGAGGAGGEGFVTRWFGGGEIKAGGETGRLEPQLVAAQGQTTNRQNQYQQSHQPERYARASVQAEPQVQYRYEHRPIKTKIVTRPPQIVQDQQGNKWWTPSKRFRVAVEQPPQVVNLPVSLGQRHYPSLAARHLAHLREGILAPWYSPSRANPLFALLIGSFIIAFLIIVTGKVLGDAYDLDSGSSSSSSSSRSGSSSRSSSSSDKGGDEAEPWYVRELTKRKDESEETTKKRSDAQNKEFVGKLKKMDSKKRAEEVKKRQREIERLKKELGRRKMPIVGLDWDFGDGKTKGTSREANERAKEGKESAAKVKTEEPAADKGGKQSVGSRMKNVFGRGKSNAPAGGGGGPGWTPADDAVAHAAIRGGAARAENMANNLVAAK